MKKRLVHKVIPNYPYEARQRRISGTVKLHVVIGVDGSVKQADYISGPEIFVKPTIDAVRQYKYTNAGEWPIRRGRYHNRNCFLAKLLMRIAALCSGKETLNSRITPYASM